MMKKTVVTSLISIRNIAFFLAWLCVAPLTAQAEMQDYPRIKLQSLDKITARTQTFEAHVGSTVKYGPLYIKIQACRKAPPIEKPESAAFLQIWEINQEEKAEWIFSGWMFASSPALSPMDHPIYDVWVLDCLDNPEEISVEEGDVSDEIEKDSSENTPDKNTSDENVPDKNVPDDETKSEEGGA